MIMRFEKVGAYSNLRSPSKNFFEFTVGGRNSNGQNLYFFAKNFTRRSSVASNVGAIETTEIWVTVKSRKNH